MTSDTPGTVNRQRIERYEAVWGSYLSQLQDLSANRLTMAEIVRRMDIRMSGYDGFIPADLLAQINRLGGCDLGAFADSAPPQRLAVINGRYTATEAVLDNSIVFSLLERHLDEDVDAIVEFGSGLGTNLARLRLRLPHLPHLTYIACEPSASGREAAKLFFSGDPKAKLETVAFDHTAPSFDCLSGFRKVVAFTSHSIEQVMTLGDDFYPRLLASPITACVHFEPIGWQRHPALVAQVASLHGDPAQWSEFTRTYRYVIEDDRLVANAAAWSVSGGYNTDLLRLVAQAAERGEIRMQASAFDVIGQNPFNPSTLLAWTRG